MLIGAIHREKAKPNQYHFFLFEPEKPSVPQGFHNLETARGGVLTIGQNTSAH